MNVHIPYIEYALGGKGYFAVVWYWDGTKHARYNRKWNECCAIYNGLPSGASKAFIEQKDSYMVVGWFGNSDGKTKDYIKGYYSQLSDLRR